MIRAVIIAAILTCGATASYAQGKFLFRFVKPVVACTCSLDFSDPANSMYITPLMAGF